MDKTAFEKRVADLNKKLEQMRQLAANAEREASIITGQINEACHWHKALVEAEKTSEAEKAKKKKAKKSVSKASPATTEATEATTATTDTDQAHCEAA